MSFETNKLVGKAGRFGAPAGAAVALVLAARIFFHHNGVHAAMISSPPPPMDDNSVSSLVALDSAVEAVAARVTPAVVNVAVTSHGSSEHQTVGSRIRPRWTGPAGHTQGLPPGFAAVLWTEWPVWRTDAAASAAAADGAWNRQRHHYLAGWLHRDEQPCGRWRDGDAGDAE